MVTAPITWVEVKEYYEQDMQLGRADQSAMLRIIEAIIKKGDDTNLYAATSHSSLIISAVSWSGPAVSWSDPALQDSPYIAITQSGDRVSYRYFPNHKAGHTHSEDCELDSALQPLDRFLLRLRMHPKR